MNNIISLLYGVFFFIIGHIAVFIQINGQFKWEWFQKNQWIVALFGIPISFLYLWGTKHTAESMNGVLWPTRFIGFGVGMIVYAIMVSYYFNESITPKVIVSLILSLALISINVFWK